MSEIDTIASIKSTSKNDEDTIISTDRFHSLKYTRCSTQTLLLWDGSNGFFPGAKKKYPYYIWEIFKFSTKKFQIEKLF